MSTRRCSLVLLTTMLFAPEVFTDQLRAQTAPHHSGVWTSATPWPGRDSFTASVHAVHMALFRGDTLFARPHSQVLAWGNWSATATTGGGLWGWRSSTDSPSQAGSNLRPLAVATPPYDLFCGGHAGRGPARRFRDGARKDWCAAERAVRLHESAVDLVHDEREAMVRERNAATGREAPRDGGQRRAPRDLLRWLEQERFRPGCAEQQRAALSRDEPRRGRRPPRGSTSPRCSRAAPTDSEVDLGIPWSWSSRTGRPR